MATFQRPLITNFSKGELSPLLEGRPDLAAFFEGGSTLENWLMLRQGGVTRRPGFRFISEVKNSFKDTTLLSFESSVDDAFIIEAGDGYDRFYKNKARLSVETLSPYTEAQLREVHYTQSVDVIFRFHQMVQQHKTSRIADTNWSTLPIAYNPPPSFPDDTDISGGTATLTPAATAGTNIVFTASSAVFLAGDVGRIIIFGASRAVIITVDVGLAIVNADILDDFPDTDPIPAGSWLLRLAPQTTLDPNKKEPVGAKVTFTAGLAAFRAADVDKFIKVYAGLAKIVTFTSTTVVVGELLAVMTGATAADPPAAPAGSWGLEVASWSVATGFTGTGEFLQGRLWQARTVRQPTTFWGSESDAFDKYAVGIEADRAIDYTMATRGFNQIQALADNGDLFIQTSGSEHRATAGKTDEPFGGDIIPLVRGFSAHGSAMIQPIVLNKRVLFSDRSRRQIFSIAFNLEEDGYDALEITGAAEHITESKIRLGPWALQKRLDPRLFFVREDGTLVSLTYHNHEKVIGFTRIVTDGTFEAVAVIPGTENDQVWVIVKRTISGQTKRYVEVMEDNASELAGRAWTSCQTDCAKVYNLAGVPTTILTNLEHLEGKTVDVVIDGSYRGTSVVTTGQITLAVAGLLTAEVGLHYNSTLRTMRPSVKDAMLEGIWRTWIKLWVRLFKSMGGAINGVDINYDPAPLGTLPMFTGDRDVTGYPDTAGLDGRISVVQNKPYPMTVLAVFGEIEFADHG